MHAWYPGTIFFFEVGNGKYFRSLSTLCQAFPRASRAWERGSATRPFSCSLRGSRFLFLYKRKKRTGDGREKEQKKKGGGREGGRERSERKKRKGKAFPFLPFPSPLPKFFCFFSRSMPHAPCLRASPELSERKRPSRRLFFLVWFPSLCRDIDIGENDYKWLIFVL